MAGAHWRHAAFWAAMLTIWCVGAFSYHNIQGLVAAQDAAQAAQELRFEAERLLSLLKDAEAGQRGFILTGDAAHLGLYDAALGTAPQIVTHLRQLVVGQNAQERRLAVLEPLITRRLTLLGENIVLRSTYGSSGIRTEYLKRGMAIMDRIRHLISEIVAEETGDYQQRARRAKYNAGISTVALALGLFVSTLVTAVVFGGMQNEVHRRGKAEAAAKLLNETLEQRVNERTAEIEAARAHAVVTAGNLAEALKRADTGSAAKSAFLANMSHELRTPLNAIIGFSDVMLTGVRGRLHDERHREYMESIAQAGRHLLSLVNDILDLARLDAGRLEVQSETVDVNTAVEDAVGIMGVQAANAKLRLLTDLTSEVLLAKADPKRLLQILLNLLSNATKFTPAGGTVTVVTARTESGISIAVRDDGIGMAVEHIPVAFERFGQIDSRLSRKFDGTGLGLPLTKSLVELQGGTLTVETALEKGTTVTVTLPTAELQSPPRSLASA